MFPSIATVNKTQLETLLQWLSDFQQYSDRIDVHTDDKLVFDELKSLGYVSGMNCGENFDGKNKENFAEYIIGQCMECIERVSTIHQIIPKFVDDWNKEFTA